MLHFAKTKHMQFQHKAYEHPNTFVQDALEQKKRDRKITSRPTLWNPH